MADQTEQHIARLEPKTALAAWWLVYSVRSAGAPLVITSSLRTLAEQQALLAQGRTRTLNSKHLTGQAFDVDVYGWNRDRVPKQFWEIIGPWAEKNLGLVWGGRWTSIIDLAHFESP